MIHYVEATDLVNKNYKVNSFHAKSCDKIGDGLKPFLISEDGIVEGFTILKKIWLFSFTWKTKVYQRI